jgi:hypothetical protein
MYQHRQGKPRRLDCVHNRLPASYASEAQDDAFHALVGQSWKIRWGADHRELANVATGVRRLIVDQSEDVKSLRAGDQRLDDDSCMTIVPRAIYDDAHVRSLSITSQGL